MNPLTPVRTLLRALPKLPATGATAWAPQTYGIAPWSEATVNEAAAMGIPAFGRAVDLIAGTIAGLTIDVYEGTANGLEPPVRVDPASRDIIFNPSPSTTRWSYLYGVISDLILYGNHLSLVLDRESDGWPRSLLPLDVTAASIHQDFVGGQIYYRIYGVELAADEVWHVTAGNRSGVLGGRGLVQQYAASLGGILAAEEFASRFYTSTAVPSGVIVHPNPNLSAKEAAAVKQTFLDAVGARRRQPVVLPVGAQYIPIVGDADKSQLLEARTWNATLVATLTGIPPVLLGLPTPAGSSLTYSNVQMVARQFVLFALTRWTRPLEQSMDRFLLPGTLFPVFDYDSLVQPDSDVFSAMLERQVKTGIITVNEARIALKLEPIEGGDTLGQEPQAPAPAPVLALAPSAKEVPDALG